MMSFKKYITGTISRIKIAFITAKTLSVLFSFLIGGVISDLFHDSTPYLGSMLAAISSIVVLPEEDFDKTLKVGWRRVLGSFIGAVMGVIYLLLFDFSIFGMVIAIFILSIICMALSVPDNGKMASVVLIWILVRSATSDLSPLLNGLLRFIESGIGVGIGIVFAWLLLKSKLLIKKQD